MADSTGDLGKWLEVNATFSGQWPSITRKKPPRVDADERNGERCKYDKYFTEEPGTGDL